MPGAGSVYSELLTQHGMRPIAVADGAAALAEMDRAADAGTPFRLVIVDAGHAGHGRLAARRPHPRRATRMPTCPIIVLVPASQAGIPARLSPVARDAVPHEAGQVFGVDRRRGRGPRRQVATSRPPSDAIAANIRPLEILLAEDGLVNQEVAVGLLEMRGHHVEVRQRRQRSARRTASSSRSTWC